MASTLRLEQLLAELREPFAPGDIAGGWSEQARAAAIEITERAIEKVAAGQKCDAAFHFIRWLDHMGVIDGPLLEKVDEAQLSIPRV